MDFSKVNTDSINTVNTVEDNLNLFFFSKPKDEQKLANELEQTVEQYNII